MANTPKNNNPFGLLNLAEGDDFAPSTSFMALATPDESVFATQNDIQVTQNSSRSRSGVVTQTSAAPAPAAPQASAPVAATARKYTAAQVQEANTEILFLKVVLGIQGNDDGNYSGKQGKAILAAVSDFKGDHAAAAEKLKTAIEGSGWTAEHKASAIKFYANPVGIKTLLTDAQMNIAALDENTRLNVASRPAAPAAAAPAVDKTAEIKFVEQALSKMKIGVGAQDGKIDADFNKGTTQFKQLLGAFSGVQVSNGVCTTAECDSLLEGLTKFLGDKKQMASLQSAMDGKVREGGLSEANLRVVNLATMGKTPAEKLLWALEYEADERANGKNDPSMKRALAALTKEQRDALPEILSTLQTDGQKLLQNLKVVYSPNVAPVVAGASAPVAATTAVSAPAVAALAPAQVAANATAAPTEKLTPAELSKHVAIVEEALIQHIAPMLTKVSGFAGKLGVSDSLFPVLTDADRADQNADGSLKFGDNSKKMTAMTVLALKEMAGYEQADGTYTKEIGDDLLFKILTDNKMKMVRDKFIQGKLDPELAQIVMERVDPKKPEGAQATEGALKEYDKVMKLRDKTKDLRKLFDSLNELERAKLLMDPKESGSVTKGNMTIDALGAMLDKFAPGLKKMLVGFLKNNEFGQMIGGALGMMGMDVSRLWEKPENFKSQEVLLRDSAEVAGKYFKSEFDKAQAAAPNASFADVMAKTKQGMMADLDGIKVKLALTTILPAADQDTIKKMMEAALDNAAKAGNPADAQAAFTNTLAEAGKQWKANKNLDITQLGTQLQAQEKAVVRAESALTGQSHEEIRAAAALRVAPGAVITEQAPLTKGQLRFTVGENIVTLTPGNVGTETGIFKDQNPVRMSNGRMQALSQVIYDNFDKLGLESVKKEDLLGKDGKVRDGASHAFVHALTELSVKAQIRIEQGKEINPKLNHATITMYALAEMQKLGVSDADRTKAKDAVDNMAHDFASFASPKKVPKAPAGGWPNVLDQTFAGYVYNIKYDPKPKPAAAPEPVAAPVAAQAAPAPAPAAPLTQTFAAATPAAPPQPTFEQNLQALRLENAARQRAADEEKLRADAAAAARLQAYREANEQQRQQRPGVHQGAGAGCFNRASATVMHVGRPNAWPLISLFQPSPSITTTTMDVTGCGPVKLDVNLPHHPALSRNQDIAWVSGTAGSNITVNQGAKP